MKDLKQFLLNIVISSRDVGQTKTLIEEFERKLKDVTVDKDGASITVIKVAELNRPFNEQ